MHTHFTAHELDLIERGLAREYRGRLIPILKGGDPSGDPLFADVPEDFSALTDEELSTFIASAEETIANVTASATEFITDERNDAALLVEIEAGIDALEAARSEFASREPEAEVEELEPEEFNDRLAALASRAVPVAVEPEVAANEADPDPEPTVPEPEPVEPEALTAAAPVPAVRRAALPKPRGAHAPQAEAAEPVVSLTAAASGLGPQLGDEVDVIAVAQMMIDKRRDFGNIAKGQSEKIGIAKARWSHLYPDDRKLGLDPELNEDLISRVVNPAAIRQFFNHKKKNSLTASGGLCAPATPYYGLQVISGAARPVRASLPSFNADRGGIRAARPASLADITSAVGIITAAHDALGGTNALKSCQVVDCPEFVETDVLTIFHCLQFGNLGARTFPERVAQFNSLVLAAHARLAESSLLTQIDAASTAVTATDIGLGASGALLGQILAAANGMRNRNRMDPEAILRVMLPDGSLDLLLSDVIRGQFQRFDTDEDKLTALLRSFDIEPTFYIDGASGASQVFGAQTAGALLPFPATVRWYLFPEGSFLFLDGGVLELGLVRDSVLNSTNDYQIFGETFENVAYIGVESLAVTSTICDSGAVSEPVTVTECGDYGSS